MTVTMANLTPDNRDAQEETYSNIHRIVLVNSAYLLFKPITLSAL